MKKLAVFIIVAFAFSMAAVAQSEPSQGTTSPEMSQPSQQQPSQPQAAPDTNMGQTTPTSNGDTASKSGTEKQLRGCIQSQGGQYVLQSKKGKTVTLTGQDVSAHAGHEVSLKGTWESAATGTGVSTGSGSSEKSFNVTSVEMISENCSGKGNTGSMGTAPNSSAPANPNSEGSGSTSNPPQQ